MRCVLCPKNFSVPIRPSWKNPKLLSQFVSPHTGLVYKKHITGLCEFMQCEVELEVKRAQQFGKIFISSFLESNQQTEILLYEPTTSLFFGVILLSQFVLNCQQMVDRTEHLISCH